MDKSQNKIYVPRLIAWEVTRRCTLKCKHCRASAKDETYEDELTTDEALTLLDNIAQHYKPIIILTGGEPLFRKDIFKIISYGNSKGLRMVLATCGINVTSKTIREMKKCGVQRISISIDGATPKSHDTFRGVKDSFDAAISTAAYAREEKLEFQINTTVTKKNVDELSDILRLSEKIGAVAYHPFLLVPTGRGKELADESLSAEEYEQVLNWIYDQSKKTPLTFKPTCAPHYYRIYHQRESNEKEKGSGLDQMTKGCLGGQAFAFISHTGIVQICGFLEIACGSLRKENLDFKKIWDNSSVMRSVRRIDEYKGRCGYCDFRKVCGGCRARAHYFYGDYLAEEPFCKYQPEKRSQ